MAPEVSFAPLADHPECQPLVADWLRSEWPSWYGPGGNGDADADVRQYTQVQQLPLGVLALDRGSPCAFGGLKRDAVPGFEQLAPWLGAGYVLPSRRGQGIGLGLIRALENEAARLGCMNVYCATSTAQSLMVRAGWSYAGASCLGGQRVAVYQRLP